MIEKKEKSQLLFEISHPRQLLDGNVFQKKNELSGTLGNEILYKSANNASSDSHLAEFLGFGSQMFPPLMGLPICPPVERYCTCLPHSQPKACNYSNFQFSCRFFSQQNAGEKSVFQGSTSTLKPFRAILEFPGGEPAKPLP